MYTKSALFSYLENYAAVIAKASGKKMLTANHITAALLQAMADMKKGSLAPEINKTEAKAELEKSAELFKPYNVDLDEAMGNILEVVVSQTENTHVEEFLYSKLMYTAEVKAKKDGAPIDTVLVMKMILAEPTATIRKYITEASASQKQSAEQPPAAFDKTPSEAAKSKKASAAAGSEKAAAKAGGAHILAKEVMDIQNIQNKLLDRVYGQDHAINTFVSGYFQSRLMARSKKNGPKPQATFLFAGPPGVGKTFLAETVAGALGLPYQRFDMSEYSDKEANFEFCGSDKVYKNGKSGNVTSFVAENPRCVLLFDEIEKSHINIIHLFLQILDAGRLRDNYTDEEVSFTDAVIIFTTNAGKNLYSDPSLTNLSALPRKKILKALSTDINPSTGIPYFPAAICSRFASGNIVMFNNLGVNNLLNIVNRELKTSVTTFKDTTKIKIDIDPNVATALILSEGGKADARTVKGRANALFHEELYEFFRLLSADEQALESIKDIKINVLLEPENPSVNKMFVNPKKPEVLIFGCKEKFNISSSEFVCHITDDMAKAKEILFNNDISVILSDIHCNSRGAARNVLNVEDIASDGHDMIDYAVSAYSIPVYLIQTQDEQISREELLSMVKLGVQDVLTYEKGKSKKLQEQIKSKCDIAYQQGNMMKLARENKVLIYKTLQTISADKTSAEILLFDFKITLATDMEDSKNILDNVSKPNILFKDVIGAEDAKKELSYFVEYLKDPIKYIRKGVRAPKGVLLYGPPGTGKTMLAKAMAGESDITFLTTEGNQFIKKFVGEGAESVHSLFAAARKYAPSILFIDEIDAIGKDRNADSSNVGDILTAFLTEMDGFNTDNSVKPVFVLAATNYEVEPGKGKSLDPALLRRFDRRIYVDLPTKDERKRFMKMKAENNKMVSVSDEQIDNIAIRSTGMSLAELDSIYEMAIRNAVCTEGCIVDDALLEEAFETFNNGEKKEWDLQSLERTARHEAGHALLCWLSGEKPSYLTVVARGDHGGYMQHANTENKGVYTKRELLDRIRTSLAGRAAEIVYYGNTDGMSTGPSGDLQSATAAAERMICCYGMDESLGLSYIDASDRNSPYYAQVRARVNEILSEQMEDAVIVITENKAAIDKMVKVLLEKNHLKEKEIDAIFTETVKK